MQSQEDHMWQSQSIDITVQRNTEMQLNCIVADLQTHLCQLWAAAADAAHVAVQNSGWWPMCEQNISISENAGQNLHTAAATAAAAAGLFGAARQLAVHRLAAHMYRW
jgi:hypothetical protein